MKKTYKKITSYLLITAIVSCSIMVTFSEVEAKDFEGNEAYWTNYCSGIISDENKIAECNAYAQYINDKLNSSEDILDGLEGEIGAVEADLSNIETVSLNFLEKIKAVEGEIQAINESLLVMEGNVQTLEEDIVLSSENIELRKDIIKERMVELQVNINTNQYLDFIMGAEDFVDLIRKTSSINLFTENDKQQITLLDAEIATLELQVGEQERLVEASKTQKENLEYSQVELNAISQKYMDMELAYEAKLAELYQAENEAETASSTLANLSPSFSIDNGEADLGDINSNGLIDPIQNSWISRGVSVGHRGVDYAANMGTPIVAPADSYVVFSCSGFGTGWLGNMDGPSKGAPLGGGNSVRVMFSVKGVTYAMNFHHLQSVPSNILQSTGKNIVVKQGTILGYVGSSGNSTGPHAHVEMFVVSGTIQQAVAKWFTTGDWQSSAGWGMYTPASGSYGTRVDPQAYL